MTIANNLSSILERIRKAEQAAGRPQGSVRLVAVSKTFPAGDVCECLAAGQRIFGENRVQEGLAKIPDVPAEAEWHLIGPLQKNKVRKALQGFSVIHSVDSLKLAEFIDSVAGQLGIRARVLFEVHVGGEESKFGFEPEGLCDQWSQLTSLPHLDLLGLMCIPPPADDPQEARPYFRQLRELRDSLASTEHPLPELSMGMSHDFETAIAEGATYVRVGTAIFGGRPRTA